MSSARASLACALFVAAVWGVLLGRDATAQEVSLRVSADTVTVGERFRIAISATHDFTSPPSFPDPVVDDSIVFGDIEVLRRLESGSSSAGGMRTDSVVYEVTTFALDTARVDPIPVLFTAGEDTFTVRTEATWVPVASLVPPDAEDIRDLAPLVEFPISVWRYVLAAAALLLLAALIAYFLWKRRQKRLDETPPPPDEPPIPPDVEAFRRLDALREMDVSRREAIKPFYVELSDTLRTYMARRLHVQALERTTREVIADLQKKGTPDDETTSRIRNILVQSDYVKFADAEPPADESRSVLNSARKVIESVERQTRPAIVHDASADAVLDSRQNA